LRHPKKVQVCNQKGFHRTLPKSTCTKGDFDNFKISGKDEFLISGRHFLWYFATDERTVKAS